MTVRSDRVDALRTPTEASPLRVLLSGCLAGIPCGADGTTYGVWSLRAVLATSPKVAVSAFCPEDYRLGTPRGVPDVHGGDGFDVLDGRARVRLDDGRDVTRELLEGAEAMLARACADRVELAILMDASGACGSQVISDGARNVPARRHRRGHGVAAALLVRHGILVIAQRDRRSLSHLLHKLDPSVPVDPAALDHDESAWVRANLPS